MEAESGWQAHPGVGKSLLTLSVNLTATFFPFFLFCFYYSSGAGKEFRNLNCLGQLAPQGSLGGELEEGKALEFLCHSWGSCSCLVLNTKVI